MFALAFAVFLCAGAALSIAQIRASSAVGYEGEPRSSNATSRRAAAEKKENSSGDSNNSDYNSDTPFASFATAERGPIRIQSDSLALDYKANAVAFLGHVHATQADGALTSNSLQVKYRRNFHDVQNITADGDVHISQGVRWCTSDRAQMDQQQHTVILTGNPVCHDARDQIAGDKITVHLDTGKSDVEAAKAMIFPQQGQTRDNEAVAEQAK